MDEDKMNSGAKNGVRKSQKSGNLDNLLRKLMEKSSSTTTSHQSVIKSTFATPIGGCRRCNIDFDSDRALLIHIQDFHSLPDFIFLNFGHQKEEDFSKSPAVVIQISSETPTMVSKDQTQDSSSTMADDVLNYFMCPDCCSTFETADQYGDHLDSHLRARTSAPESDISEDSNLFKCPECKSSFLDVNQYQEHMKSIHGFQHASLSCTVCGETFGTQIELNQHMGSHTGATNECKICGKCYRSRKNLIHHVRMHTGERPHVCGECGKCFIKSDSLRVHSMTHRPSTKPFSCPECGWKFAFRKDLDVHIRTHTGEKPFECLQCGKTFSQKKSLKNHRKNTHNDQPPDVCMECGDRFQTEEELDEHSKLHLKPSPAKPENEELSGAEENGEQVVSSNVVHPKYRKVSHALENDYLNGLLQGICRKQNPRRLRDKSDDSRASSPVAETVRSESADSSRKTPAGGLQDLEEIHAVSPLQNDYFKGLLASNVRKYNRQRIKDPVSDYMESKEQIKAAI